MPRFIVPPQLHTVKIWDPILVQKLFFLLQIKFQKEKCFGRPLPVSGLVVPRSSGPPGVIL